MSKVACIDIGSNSIRLLICERDGSTLFSKRKQKRTTRLGADISFDGLLNEKRIDESLEALSYFKNICTDENVDEVIVYATSAVRDAKNKDKFIRLVKEKIGLDILVLSGKEEAEIGFIGAYSLDSIKPSKIQMVLDVGGSSTEICLAENSEIVYMKSFKIGAVRYLNDFFQDADELTGMKTARNDMEDKMEDAFDFLCSKKPLQVVLIGGTATTMAMHLFGLDEYKAEKINAGRISIDNIKEMLDLVYMTEPENRKKLDGIEEQRAEIILQGLMIIEFILKSIGIKDVLISDNDSLEGAILKFGKSGI